METLARELGPRGLVVLAVNYQEDPGTVAEFAREYGLSVPILLDRSGDVAARYRVVGLPATFLIDRGGSLVGTALGFRDWGGAPARSYLDALLGPAS